MRYQKLLQLLWITGVLFVSAKKGNAQFMWNPGHSIGTANGVYSYSNTQTPSPIMELSPAAIPNFPALYQWWSSSYPTIGFSPIAGATSSSYSPPAITASSVTTYYYRVTTSPTLGSRASNTVKISVVSTNWEDINYIREHDVLDINNTTPAAVDVLPIGSKLQTTTYLDGLGRPVEKVGKQTATPSSGSSTWGDMVQFSVYDAFNREPAKYIPYTTTNQSGKFKTAPLTDQTAYFANPATYNETSAFAAITFDNSPLNRVVNVKEAGASWAASAGNTASYDMNLAADNVQILTTDYVQGDAPVNKGVYPANTLYKMTSTDVNGNQVVDFTNISGQVILTKVQATATPGPGNTGWICTYYVYDEFGQLRFQIQPEGVKYLDTNSWSFAGANGAAVLAEQVFQYHYDDRGRTIWKKAPGATALQMLYDVRDRVVFMQDGNQAALSTPQWTVNLYDVLDRPVLKSLFNTTETIANLQSDLNGAAATNNITVTTAANCGGSPITVATSLCPSSLIGSALNSPASTVVLKYFFYDNYNFPNAAAFNTSYTNLTAYSTSDPNVMPIAKSMRVLSLPTGDLVRVLGSTSTFLASTSSFDEKGRPIQVAEGNVRGGTDITTRQYRWDGRLLSTCNSHTNTSAGYTAFVTLNKFIFDNIGRVSSIQKQVGVNAMKTIANYDYDDMGRLKTKHLDPNYNNPNSGLPDLESLTYSFDIHNQITGINKDYANKAPATYNKWVHFFGLAIGYDNRDNQFAAARLNGQVTGQVWSTQGDDVQRRYDYTYDNANRLIKSIYLETQTANTGWNHTAMDFRVTGHNGQMTYDLNGNLLTMQHTGVMPGNPSPFNIDDLFYAYNTYSNKLQKVLDGMTATTVNGLLGDFKDGTNGSTPDYVYDANGNTVVDLNKNVQSLNNGAAGTNGIHYNFLDKPDQIRLVGQGTIEIVYSADGEKLQRVFVPESSGASTITTYIGPYVYQETSTTLTGASLPPFAGTDAQLSYINFEEGRIRVMTPVNTSGWDTRTEAGNLVLPNAATSGVWDYFIRDYQQNVRMILTEETHNATNRCNMETNRAVAEDPVFGQTGAGNEVEVTRTAVPTAWQSVNTSASCSGLGNLAGHNIGPNSLLKVMAGDLINTSVQYYYQSPSTSSNPDIIPNILNSLSAAITGPNTAGSLVHGNATAISNQLTNSSAFISAVEPSNATSGTPQAYLTVLFFDERFNLVPASNGGVVQQQVASSWTTTTPAIGWNNIKAPKNGYVFIYVSNRSDQTVYFDNLVISLTAGNIIEENHYYPFGLKIAAICSKKLGDAGEGALKNNYLYNDKELFDDGGLNWYDYGFRNYDPQIGRFPQLDPLTDSYPELTPYQYAGDEPISNIDIDGLESGLATGANTWSSGASTISELMNVGRFSASAALRATSQVSSVSKAIELAKVTKIALLAIKVAAVVVRAQVATQTLNKGASSPAVQSQLSQAMDALAKEHLELNDDDIFRIGVAAKNYFKGLNLMAWWSKRDFAQLDRTVISGGTGHISELKIVGLVQAGIENEQQGVSSVLREGANVALFISFSGLFPEVGMGPRGPRINSNLQQGIVNASKGAKGGKYAFGLKDQVVTFSDEIGASHLMKDPNWKRTFLNIIKNSKNELHFTLDGIDETPMQMILSPGRSGINWEMYTLYNSPAFENTVFYYGGIRYKGFEVFKINPL